MSDIEHELVWESLRLQDRLEDLSEVARRSLTTAIAAQDHAFGRHDAWLDDELAAVADELRQHA